MGIRGDRNVLDEPNAVANMSSALTQVFNELGKILQSQHKPISTLALLRALRQHQECAAWYILHEAKLLQLPLPAEIDEGDAGIFSDSLHRVLISAEVLASSDDQLGTQHTLLALARDQKGQAGKWLRDNGFDLNSVPWGTRADPTVAQPVHPTVWGRRFWPIVNLCIFLGIGLLEGPNDPLGILYGFVAVLILPALLVGWSKSSYRLAKPGKCCRCNREFELKAMLDRDTGLCRICERAIEQAPGRDFWVVLAILALCASISSYLFVPLAYLLANILLAVALGCVATILHEAGHALMAWVTGHTIFSVHLGRGPVKFCKRLGKVWFYTHAPLLGGMVIALNKARWFRRLRSVVFCLGGPGTNLLLAWACWPHFQASSDWSVIYAWTKGIDPTWSFFLINLAMGLTNLIPGQVKLEGGQVIDTDGRQVLDILKAGRAGSVKLQQQVALIQAEIYQSYRNSEAQLELFQCAISEPDRTTLQAEALMLSDLERHVEALDILSQLGDGDPEASPEQRGLEANNFAWIYYQAGEFEKADQLSAESLEALPSVSYALGTRGEVLASLGNFTAGKELLWRAVRSTRSPKSAALNLHALTRLAALEGEEAEFQRMNDMMLELDPTVKRYETVAAAREAAHERGHCLNDQAST